ncbi:MAG: radical SAM protein [Bacilli bacterium]|nr:radical SAM protein [Candidatus Paceibacterota bacterium]MDD4411715.1 radical SAM protein [Bacilli bacterium]
MKELDIKLGYNCNNNCLFCLNKDKRGFGYATEELKKQIEISANNGCKKLIISGGEPLIYNNFFEIVKFARERGIPNYQIQTNGRMLFYGEMVERIKRICPNVDFLVSFHYPNAEMYKKYSQVDGFNQVLEGLKNLQKHSLKFTTNTVLFKENIKFLNEILSTLSKVDCKYSQFRFIDGHNVGDDFFDFVPRMEEAVSEIKKVIFNYPELKIYIHEIPACVLGRDLEDYITSMPNIERENFNLKKEVLTSPEIVRQQFIYPNCDGCMNKMRCLGVRKSYLKFFDKKEFNPIISKLENYD